MQQEWKKQRIAWELTVTGSRCWGGGQGVSRGGERGDDGHHKDGRGSGDRRHFLQVVLSSRERGQRDTDQNDRLLWVPLPLALGGQDEKERERSGVWRLVPSGDAQEREGTPRKDLYSLISWWNWWNRTEHMQGRTRSGRPCCSHPPHTRGRFS